MKVVVVANGIELINKFTDLYSFDVGITPLFMLIK